MALKNREFSESTGWFQGSKGGEGGPARAGALAGNYGCRNKGGVHAVPGAGSGVPKGNPGTRALNKDDNVNFSLQNIAIFFQEIL